MKEYYKKSLQMIKVLKIKNLKQYNKYKNYFFVLNIQSLKYISGENDFKNIIKIANEI